MAYSLEKIDQTLETILLRVENGEAIRTILKEKGMPSSKTFYEWLDSDELKVKRYARATTLRAKDIFEEMLEIADDASQDLLATDRGEIGNMVKVQRDKLRIDTRKWALSKLEPKKYGDSVKLTGDADNPIQSKLTIEVLPASGRIASSESDIDD
jgi:hypothetical protein